MFKSNFCILDILGKPYYFLKINKAKQNSFGTTTTENNYQIGEKIAHLNFLESEKLFLLFLQLLSRYSQQSS